MTFIIKNKKYEDKIIPYVLICFACLNFFEAGSTIWLFYVLISTVFFNNRTLKIDFNIILCAFLTFTVLITSIIFYSFNDIIKSFIYIFTYIAGYSGYKNSINKENYIKRIILSMYLGYATQVFLIYIYNTKIEKTSIRSLRSIWTNENISVTLVALMCSVLIAYSFYLLFCTDGSCKKVIAILSILLVVTVNASTATRTPFLLLIVVYTVMLSLYKVKKIKIKYIMIIFIFIIIIIIYNINIFNIKYIVESSPIYLRMSDKGFETGRIERIGLHFSKMFTYMIGCKKISNIYGHAHNYIQEVHDLYGIFALISVIGLSINFVINIKKFIMMKNKTSIIYVLLSLYISIIIQMLLEPVFEGYPILFWNMLFIHAISTAHLNNYQVMKNNKLIKHNY